ncbi:MAG: hypothetical protein K6B72_13795 [Lachnospiraceae bacterium]|nr:hypothetical protein [Lachnospiraceae bacterium]
MKKRYSVKKDLIILSSIVIAAIIASVLVIIHFKASSETPVTEVHFTEVETEAEANVDVYSDPYMNPYMYPADVSIAGDEEELPKVETATDGTKIESTPETAVLAKKEGAREGYLNRCVFLGDSRTVAMVDFALFNDDAALAQIGISHQVFASNLFRNNAGREYTLSSYLASHQAPVIYIALGVNGMDDPSEEHYKKTYLALIDSIMKMAPNSNIVLMSIGPVDDNSPYRDKVQNAKIDRYNGFLLDTAKEKDLYYLNIAEILKGSNGQLKSVYNGGDGLHYSKSGCEAIFKYIVEHPVPGVSDAGEYVVRYIPPDPNRMKTTDANAEAGEGSSMDLSEDQQETVESEEEEKTEEDEEEKEEGKEDEENEDEEDKDKDEEDEDEKKSDEEEDEE